ncbi:MAG: hypothetical protein WEA10_06030 [Actinomycetota bacterium]
MQAATPHILRRALTAAIAAALVIVALPSTAFAFASTVPNATPLQIGDREVKSVAQVGSRIYLGGNFRWVGPSFNGSAGFAEPNGLGTMTVFPEVTGNVLTAISDGAGGLIIGGSFTAVGGLPRANIAQVNSTGAVTTFNPGTNGPVNALVRDGSGNVYLGGKFSAAGGQARQNLARVTSAGAISTFAFNTSASASDEVRALALSGNSLFVGGTFTTLGATGRVNFGAINTSTNALTTLNPAPNNTVNDLVANAAGTTLYAGGNFTQIAGQNRGRVAALTVSTGAAQALNGGADAVVNDLELSPNEQTLFVGGAFKNISGSPVRGIAGLNPSTSAITEINNSKTSGIVNTIEVSADGTKLWYGGTFNHKSPKALRLIAQVDLAAANDPVTDWQPPIFNGLSTNPKAGVNTMLTVGSKLFMGGTFRSYGGQNKEYLVAVNAATGALDATFSPVINGQVNTVVPSADGQSLYIGGVFTQVGGQTRTRIAKINASTGALVGAFGDPVVNKLEVFTLALTGNKLYAGGQFTKVGGNFHRRIALLDATTGVADTSFAIDVDGAVRDMDLTSTGQSLFISGDFATVGGLARFDVAKINTNTDAVEAWAPAFFGTGAGALGRKLDVAPNDSAVYVASAGPTGTPASNLARFPTTGSGNVAPTWTNDVQDAIEAVAVGSDAIYIGGHFNDVANGANPRVDRFQLAALDPATGLPLNWDVNAGGYRGIFDMQVGAAGLIVGGDSIRIASKGHRGYAVFPGA